MGDKEYDNPFSAYVMLKRNRRMKSIISKRMNELQINSLKHENLSNIKLSQSFSKSTKFVHQKKSKLFKSADRFSSLFRATCYDACISNETSYRSGIFTAKENIRPTETPYHEESKITCDVEVIDTK